MPAPIKHVFVLMLENRSFDHMFGFSGLTGKDAENGDQTSVAGLKGGEKNSFGGVDYPASRTADFAMSSDPGHEFEHVLDQLCGPGAGYPSGGTYPTIDNSGFVDSYTKTGGAAKPGEVMRCFDTRVQLPIIYQLAEEFALCDNWFASMPGPTWPNRLFAHAASAGGLDHSPLIGEILVWETFDGFAFPNGSLYDRLKSKNIPYRFYAGDSFPVVASLKHVSLTEIQNLAQFQKDVQTNPFPYSYVVIEPSYNVADDYRTSSCQHPLADVRDGENLIKFVYETLRNSPAWSSSVLIITWDEHGGFYDHVAPPSAVAPGDTAPNSNHNQHGFTFAQCGPRVPAVVVSPFVPRNTVDHRRYEHSSLPATAAALFGTAALTERDTSARNVLPLLSLTQPREDAPTSLGPPAPRGAAVAPASPPPTLGFAAVPTVIARPNDSANEGSLPGVVHAALRQDLEMAAPGDRPRIMSRVARIRTRGDAMRYLSEVAAKAGAARAKLPSP